MQSAPGETLAEGERPEFSKRGSLGGAETQAAEIRGADLQQQPQQSTCSLPVTAPGTARGPISIWQQAAALCPDTDGGGKTEHCMTSTPPESCSFRLDYLWESRGPGGWGACGLRSFVHFIWCHIRVPPAPVGNSRARNGEGTQSYGKWTGGKVVSRAKTNMDQGRCQGNAQTEIIQTTDPTNTPDPTLACSNSPLTHPLG